MIHQTVIIGAGVAGTAAATRLRRNGGDVLVLEKSRGLGGRAATRRWDDRPVDHGAQFFTARSEEFRAQVGEWMARDVCHEWTRGFHQFRDGELAPPDGDLHPRYACREGMSSLARTMAAAQEIDVERQAKIAAVHHESGVWLLSCEEGREFRCRTLIVTCPPPQGALLLAAVSARAAEMLREASMDPCLAVAARFPRRETVWRGIQSDDAVLSWIGNDTSKRPELHAGQTIVVMHASPEFSRENYETPENDVMAKILDRASEISGQDLRGPEAVFLQRWRYAQAAKARDERHAVFFDAPAPLILAGEYFAGGKIEGAWLSGQSAAELAAKA